MRKSPNRKPSVVVNDEVINGLRVVTWRKTCPVCGKEFETSSRGQKYCSEKCCERAQKKHAKNQREYKQNAELNRLASRAHSMAVEVYKQYVAIGMAEHKCECCGATEGLQVHHKNLNWLDNRLENLQCLCTKCHSKVHSDIEKEGKEYDPTFKKLIEPIIKS